MDRRASRSAPCRSRRTQAALSKRLFDLQPSDPLLPLTPALIPLLPIPSSILLYHSLPPLHATDSSPLRRFQHSLISSAHHSLFDSRHTKTRTVFPPLLTHAKIRTAPPSSRSLFYISSSSPPLVAVVMPLSPRFYLVVSIFRLSSPFYVARNCIVACFCHLTSFSDGLREESERGGGSTVEDCRIDLRALSHCRSNRSRLRHEALLTYSNIDHPSAVLPTVALTDSAPIDPLARSQRRPLARLKE